MDELRVPKRRIDAQLLLRGGGVRRVGVFIAEFASAHSGPERLSDLLNQRDEFIPALDLDSDRMLFINREQVAVAFLDLNEERDTDSQHTIPLEHEVVVTLADGQILEGLIGYVLPPERERLNDFLNDPAAFFRLIQTDRLGLINKRHVSQIEVLRK